MMQRWADEEEQERSRFPHRNNGKRHNDSGGPATSGILRASISLTIQSAQWIAPHVVRRMKSHRISLTRSSTTRGAQSIVRATTRCGNARSYASPSSLHHQTLLRRSRTRMTRTTRKTLTDSNSNKTSSMSYSEEILASPCGPKSYYSERSSQLSQQFRGH